MLWRLSKNWWYGRWFDVWLDYEGLESPDDSMFDDDNGDDNDDNKYEPWDIGMN